MDFFVAAAKRYSHKARFAGPAVPRDDLRKIVEELTDFFGPQADAAHVVMRTALPEQPLPCRVDGKLIKQALLNLMINGVQAMDEGGELLVRLSALRDEAIIEIIDTGPGIAPEDLSRIFEVYYSTKKSGSGLGKEYVYDVSKYAKIDTALIIYEGSKESIVTGFEESRAIAIGSAWSWC